MHTPQETVALLPLPGSMTIVADEQIKVVPSPTIIAKTKVSTCTMNDVEHLRKQFYLPADISTRVMTAEERLNRPSYPLVAFKAIMKHGARLPLRPLVRGVLAHFGLSLSPLNPNAYKIMVGMHIL